MERGGEPGGGGEAFGQPAGIVGEVLRIGGDGIGRHQQRQTAGQAVGEIGASEAVSAFGSASPPAGDEAGQASVGGPVGGEEHQRRPVLESDAAADDQLEGFGLQPPCRIGAHYAGQRAFVGDGERGVAEGDGLFDQLFRMRGAGEKTETGTGVKLGKRGEWCSGHELTV